MEREEEEDQDKYGWTHAWGIREEPSYATSDDLRDMT